MSSAAVTRNRVPHGEVVRRMRPLQRTAAKLLIEAVISGRNVPDSIDAATALVVDQLGSPWHFVTERAGWEGELREAAVYWLIVNGFAKGGAVRRRERQLDGWTTDADILRTAAEIEYDHGGNARRAAIARDQAPSVEIIGEGERAVYVYTDSRLDQLGDVCTKIGRNSGSGLGEVLARIVEQYGTANPGKPRIHCICRTNDEYMLETELHTRFSGQRIWDGVGSEWFAVPVQTVRQAIQEILDRSNR